MEIICKSCFKRCHVFEEFDAGGAVPNQTVLNYGIGETVCDVQCVNCGHEFDITKVAEARYMITSKNYALASAV